MTRLRASSDATDSHGFGAGFGGEDGMYESHAHADVELNFVYSGSIRYFLGGRFFEVPRGRLTLFWAGLPHQVIDVRGNASFMWLHVPFGTLLRWGLGTELVRAVLDSDALIDLEGQAWDGAMTRYWVADVVSGDPVVQKTVELEVEARVRRLVRVRHQRSTSPAIDAHRVRLVEQMMRQLSERYRDDIDANSVVKALKLRPGYAATLFRKACGVSMAQYLTRLRLSHAQLELLSSDKTVLAIALESGFGSLASFYKVFRQACGVAPGDYRRNARRAESFRAQT